MAILFCYCLGAMGLRGSENTKCPKMFSLIARPNLNGFELSIRDFKTLPEPIKMTYHNFISINASRFGGVRRHREDTDE